MAAAATSDPVTGGTDFVRLDAVENFDQTADAPRRQRLPAVDQRLAVGEPRARLGQFVRGGAVLMISVTIRSSMSPSAAVISLRVNGFIVGPRRVP
jgi:hypothetical protein